MREQVLESARKHAEKNGFDVKEFKAGADYAIRYFKEYFILELAYQNKLLKAREGRKVRNNRNDTI